MGMVYAEHSEVFDTLMQACTVYVRAADNSLSSVLPWYRALATCSTLETVRAQLFTRVGSRSYNELGHLGAHALSSEGEPTMTNASCVFFFCSHGQSRVSLGIRHNCWERRASALWCNFRRIRVWRCLVQRDG